MKKLRNAAGPLKDLYRQTACQANQIAMDIFSLANTPYSRELKSKLESSDYSSIVSASVVPTDYTNADIFRRDYLCAELMSKFPSWELGLDRAHVALAKFNDVELQLSSLDLHRNPVVAISPKRVTMRAVEMTARLKISKILGEFDWNECEQFFGFGPGASTSMSRRRGDSSYKFGAEEPQMSYNLAPLADAIQRSSAIWRFKASVVSGSRVTTVPKNAKTDRVICIEPDLNMYVQKGIGRVIRNRLRRWGLLHPWAQRENAELAREGSATGRLATVDLSSASDSIHMDVVRQLLPPEWVSAIELCRSPSTVLPSGEVKLLRKVSSMGNGFTFELETLIFYGLCQAVIELISTKETDRRCKVYGDDIIIDADLEPYLRVVLEHFGFTVNLKKTFRSGPFRESCGKHYFAGIDVTPFYVRGPVDSVLRVYWAANQIRRHSRLPWGLDPLFEPAYRRLVHSLPRFWQDIKIPEGYGDGGLIADWDEVCPIRAPKGFQGWRYRAVLPKTGSTYLDGVGTLIKCLKILETGRVEEGRELRPSDPWSMVLPMCELPKSKVGHAEVPKPLGFKVSKLVAPQWPSYGPWLDTASSPPQEIWDASDIADDVVTSAAFINAKQGVKFI